MLISGISDFFLFFPLVLIFLLIFIVFVFGIFYKNTFYFSLIDDTLRRLTIFYLILILLTLFLNFIIVSQDSTISEFFFFNFFRLNRLSSFNQILIIFFFICFFSVSYFYDINVKINSFELILMSLSVLLGSLFLLISTDLVVSYLSIEFQTLPVYALLSYFKHSKKSIEAGLKYFFLSAFSSGFLLFGISLVYYYCNITAFAELGLFFELFQFNGIFFLSNFFFFFALGLIFISIFFKLSIAPFHFWSPDVYDGPPISVLLLFSTISKFSVFIFLINLLYTSFFPFFGILHYIFFFFGFLSILVGTLGGFFFFKISRVLAYGSVSHVGFILLSLGCFTNDSVFISFFYMVSYLLTTILFFSVWLNITYDNTHFTYITDFYGFYRVSPFISFILAVAVFSFAGIPPTLGFFSKLLVLILLLTNNSFLLALSVFLISIVSAVYYIRFIKFVYFYDQSNLVKVDLLPENVMNYFLVFFTLIIIFGSFVLLLSF